MTELNHRPALPIPENGSSPSLFDLGPLPMWVHDGETSRFLAVNDSALRAYGYRRDRFLALTLDELRSAEMSRQASRTLGEEPARRTLLRCADGCSVEVELTTQRIEYAGRPAWLVSAVDAGGLVRLEQELAELRRSEKRFRQLSETASDWFWEADANGYLTYLSPKYETLYGQPLSDIIGRRVADMPGVTIPPAMIEKAREAIKARQPSYEYIYSIQPPEGGKLRWIETTVVPLFGDNEALQGFRGASRDITARVSTEQALRDSEQRFRRLFEIGADYYWEDDAQHRLIFTSPAPVFEEICGMPLAQLLGRRLTESLAVSFDPEMGRRAIAAFKTRSAYRDVVFSVKRANGEVRWVSTSGAPRFGSDGEFVGYHGTGVEITARKDAEAASQLARRQMHEAVVHVTQPFVVFDAEDRAIAFNQAFADLLRTSTQNTPVHEGVCFRDLAEWQVQTRFYADGPDEEPVDVETLLAHHQSEDEHTWHLRDGRRMMVIHRRLPGGGRVGLWTDVTAMVNAQVEADRANKAKSIFLATISHEIRTPLNGVLGMAQAMRFDELAPAQRQRLDVIQRSGEALLALLNDVLDISKIEAGKIELEQIDFDLGIVVRSAYEVFLAITAEKGVVTALDVAAGEGIFHGDPTRVRQIVSNLLSNAVKFTERGRIAVQARRTEDGVRIVVRDTGIGMTMEAAQRIFEKFSQADASTTRRFGGTGLGLSICRELTSLMGGSISVDSTPGRGSTFTVDLPLAYVRPAEPPAETPTIDPAEFLAGRTTPLRVLVAEDNQINQRVLRALLSAAGDLDVQMVANGMLAIEAWERQAWDLIFMDVNMPVMDGVSATRQIRSREHQTRRRRTPIVALTANAMAHQIDEYRVAGMDGHLAKPIDAASLFASLAMAAAEAPNEPVGA
jgi:PAS domain S-box-containing protein